MRGRRSGMASSLTPGPSPPVGRGVELLTPFAPHPTARPSPFLRLHHVVLVRPEIAVFIGAVIDDRRRLEIAMPRHGIARGPFERVGVPRVPRRPLAEEQRPQEVRQENQLRGAEEQCRDAHELVERDQLAFQGAGGDVGDAAAASLAATPAMCIGKKVQLRKTNVKKKCTLPRLSFISRPNIFGNQ